MTIRFNVHAEYRDGSGKGDDRDRTAGGIRPPPEGQGAQRRLLHPYARRRDSRHAGVGADYHAVWHRRGRTEACAPDRRAGSINAAVLSADNKDNVIIVPNRTRCFRFTSRGIKGYLEQARKTEIPAPHG